jgi:hypothetical protein
MNYPLKDLAEFITRHGEAKIGITIRCPGCGMKFSAWFQNPIGDVEPAGRVQWRRVGETLEDLSLNPSFMFVGHCHSWITNGEVRVDSAFTCPPIEPEHVV